MIESSANARGTPMRRILLCLIVGMSIAACSQPSSLDRGQPEETAPQVDAKACAAAGGEVRPVCRRGLPACVLTFSDAGKACTDKADCQGKCLLVVEPPAPGAASQAAAGQGQCQANNDPCGCRTEILGGIAQPGICID